MPDDQWWDERAERHFLESEMRAGDMPRVGHVPQLVYLPPRGHEPPRCIVCGVVEVLRFGEHCQACRDPNFHSVIDDIWCRTCGYPKGDQGHPGVDCPPGTTDGRWQTTP